MRDRRVPYGLHHPEAHSVVGPVHLHHGKLLRNDTASRLPTEQLSGLSGKTENTLCTDLHPSHETLIPLQMRNHLSATRRLSVYPGLPAVHHTDLTHIYEPHPFRLRARGPRPRAKTQHKKRGIREYINSSTYGFTALLLSSPYSLPERTPTQPHIRIMFVYHGNADPVDSVKAALLKIADASTNNIIGMQQELIRFAQSFLSNPCVHERHILRVCTTLAKTTGQIASNGLKAIGIALIEDQRYIGFAESVTKTLSNMPGRTAEADQVVQRLQSHIRSQSTGQANWDTELYSGNAGTSSSLPMPGRGSLSQKRGSDPWLEQEPAEKKQKDAEFAIKTIAAFNSMPSRYNKTPSYQLFSGDFDKKTVSKSRPQQTTGSQWDTFDEPAGSSWGATNKTSGLSWDSTGNSSSQLVSRNPYADYQLERRTARDEDHESAIALRGATLTEHIRKVLHDELPTISQKIRTEVIADLNVTLDNKFNDMKAFMQANTAASASSSSATTGTDWSTLGLKRDPAQYTFKMIVNEILTASQFKSMKPILDEKICDDRSLKIYTFLTKARSTNETLRTLLHVISKKPEAEFHKNWNDLCALHKAQPPKPRASRGRRGVGEPGVGEPGVGEPDEHEDEGEGSGDETATPSSGEIKAAAATTPGNSIASALSAEGGSPLG